MFREPREEIQEKAIYSVNDVCRLLEISQMTCHRWIKEGIIPAKKFGLKYVILGSALLKALQRDP